MIFEVEDCAVASPATVSRLGVVWIPPEALGFLAFPITWLCMYVPKECPEELKELLKNLIVDNLGEGILTVRRDCKEKLGSIIRFPNAGNVYDYCVDIESKEFRLWEEITSKFLYDKTQPYSSILVPTKDTVRFSYLTEAFTSVNRGTLLVGESGTGKSVIMVDCLNNLAEPGTFLTRTVPGNLIPFTINFSAPTSSPRTQEMLELRFEKRRKGVMGAPLNKKLVCFIDDCNMPAREEYGAQPPIELLRMIIDTLEHYRKHGGLYDRKKLDYYHIVDMVVVSACGPPGGGRNFVTARYFRHFSMLTVDAPSRSVLGVIFFSVLDGHLGMFPAEIKALAKTTVDSSIDIYTRISEEMLPTPAKSHYTFNLRDLSKVFQGVLSLKVNNCPDVKTFLRVWCHENQRVFQDRLIDNEDKDQFQRWVSGYVNLHAPAETSDV